MSTVIDLMNRHIEIWSDTSHESRRKAIAEVYSENCRVYDPFYPDVSVGRDELMTLIDEAQGKFPKFGFTIIPCSLDEHHGQVRLSWYFGPSDSPQAITGQDFMIIENGIIHSVVVFVDRPAE
jgi:hypothetical protein